MPENIKRNWKSTFFVIWSGQAFSLIGSSAAQFALIWWINLTTGSAMSLTWATMAAFLPQAFIGVFAGAWVDRLSRKKVMMCADSFIALCSCALAVYFYVGDPPLEFIYAMLFLRGVGGVFHGPAMQAAMPMLVPPEQITKVGGWSQFIQSGSFMIGPVLGAALMAAFPLEGVMLVDILGAALAVGTMALVKIPDPPPIERKHVFHEIMDGFKLVIKNKPLYMVSIPLVLCLIFYLPVSALYPLIVLEHFNGTAWHSSLVELVFALGMMVASTILGIWGKGEKRFLMMSASTAALGLFIGVAGLLPPQAFIPFVICCALMGATGPFFNVPYIAYIQTTVAPEALGRVLSLVTSVMSFASPVGLIIAGPMAELLGVNVWFAISGLIMVFIGLMCYFMTHPYDKLDLPGAKD